MQNNKTPRNINMGSAKKADNTQNKAPSQQKAFNQNSHTQREIYANLKNAKKTGGPPSQNPYINQNNNGKNLHSQNPYANTRAIKRPPQKSNTQAPQSNVFYDEMQNPYANARSIKRPPQNTHDNAKENMPFSSEYQNYAQENINNFQERNAKKRNVSIKNAPQQSTRQKNAPMPNGATYGTVPKNSRQNNAPMPNEGTYGTVSQKATRTTKGKKSVFKIMFSVFLCLVLAAGVFVGGVYIYASSIINEGEIGSVTEEIQTPPQLANDQLSILVVGIDNTEFDATGSEVDRNEIGNTDMIMYVRFDFANDSMYMLQIPRDLFMGEELNTGGSGKLTTLFSQGGEDGVPSIDDLAVPLSELLQLPIDGYVTIDMISLREIVDVFGGIEVYVAEGINLDGSIVPQGWQTLHGDMLEVFLRYRDYPTGDIARLENQRYFYSALFRRLRTATWQDIVKLMPVAQQYVNTDISVIDAAALAINVLSIPSSNIMMCKLPNFDSTENYNYEHAVQIGDAVGTADLLNTYFRTPEMQISAEQYNFAYWPHSATAHGADVQFMDAIDSEGGGSVGVAAGDVQTGDNLLNPPESENANNPQSTAVPAQGNN